LVRRREHLAEARGGYLSESLQQIALWFQRFLLGFVLDTSYNQAELMRRGETSSKPMFAGENKSSGTVNLSLFMTNTCS